MKFIEPKVSPYVEFTYYENEYKGNEIKTAAEFDRLIKRVTAMLDEMTFERIKGMDTIPDCVKDCLCGMAETYNGLQVVGTDRKVTSESNDGFSQSFKEYDEESIKVQARNVAQTYLANTGLMYRGFNAYDYELRRDSV